MKIAYLTCRDLLPGAADRRADAFEHDLQVAAFRAGVAAAGAAVIELDWRAPIHVFDGFGAAILGSAWDYQDHAAEFLSRLDELSARGVRIANPPDVVRWNIDKAYLKELAARGVAVIPTMWRDDPCGDDIRHAFERFNCERVVVKRRIGAGAVGQRDFSIASAPPPEWRLGRPGLIQPFVPSIQTEGEHSLIFIGGEFSHAVVKRPLANDYRIQSTYGGVDAPSNPGARDMNDALRVLGALPFDAPLYARIDMVRGSGGGLWVMEVELIEPYLYPAQGPSIGPMIGDAFLGTMR